MEHWQLAGLPHLRQLAADLLVQVARPIVWLIHR